MKTRRQEDAGIIFQQVSELENLDKEYRQNYARAVYRFPILVRINGLQQTIGFYEGKAESGESGRRGEGKLLEHLRAIFQSGQEQDFSSQKIAKMDMAQYLWHSRRCLEVSIWYRRFVESILKVDLTGVPDEAGETSGKEAGDE